MTKMTHQIIRQSILERIQKGEWGLGDLIPGEASLAEEYGCARTTINRALQGLADEGLVVRKRKGGTRVCNMPVRQARFDIPIVREQVEAFGLEKGTKALQLDTVHLADGRPFAYEARWVNLKVVPQMRSAPFDEVSANEWLVQTVPFSSGDVSFSAVAAGKDVASALECKEGDHRPYHVARGGICHDDEAFLSRRVSVVFASLTLVGPASGNGACSDRFCCRK